MPDELFSGLKSRLLAVIEESVIPYRVEVVNFDRVEEDFKKAAMKDIIIWKKMD